jgi:hypothetical protein
MKCKNCGELQDDHYILTAAGGEVLLEYVCPGQIGDIDTFTKD